MFIFFHIPPSFRRSAALIARSSSSCCFSCWHSSCSFFNVVASKAQNTKRIRNSSPRMCSLSLSFFFLLPSFLLSSTKPQLPFAFFLSFLRKRKKSFFLFYLIGVLGAVRRFCQSRAADRLRRLPRDTFREALAQASAPMNSKKNKNLKKALLERSKKIHLRESFEFF